MIRFSTAVVFLAFLSVACAKSDPVMAGQETHGGNAVICEGKPPVLLDYYHASLPTLGHGLPKLIALTGMSAEQVVSTVRERISSPVAQVRFDQALLANGKVDDWIATDLRGVDDSAEPYILPPGCKRITAAVRQGNVMYVDPSVYTSLAPEQQGLLWVHEALYRMSGQDTSENIRNLMRTLLRDSFTREELMASVRLISPFFNWEGLFGNYKLDGSVDLACTYIFESARPDMKNAAGDTFKGVFTMGMAIGCTHNLFSAGAYCSSTSDDCTFVKGGCTVNMNDPAKLVMLCPDGSKTVLIPE